MGVRHINRKGFMAEFRSLLAFMDPEDRARALRRYERMFDQAGEDGEEELLQRLGSPIRQVLEVEAEYRKAQKEGRTPFDDEPAAVPLDAEVIPSLNEEPPMDLGQTVKEAAEELSRQSDEEVPPPETVEEDLFPIADLDDPENLLPEEIPEGPESDPVTEEPGLSEGEAPEASSEKEPPAPADTQPPEEVIPSSEEEKDLDRIMEFAAAEKKPVVPDWEEDGEEDLPDEKPGAGRIFAAILVTVPFIALWILGFILSLALGAVFMAAGFALCVAGVYFAGYVIHRMIAYMPDMLLVAGGALGCFALALLFIWTGLWIAVGGCVGVVRLTANAYRRILKKRLPEEDEDDE